ncbi:mitochondrial carrier domain-containing protein [Tanacetum coccineum]|uniref:Mitochondrial carrier domain-containing protein n=1 Tax=Tanacetum coccineum TaxID=301880 RepID=A0ABQ5GKR1_9ASTR
MGMGTGMGMRLRNGDEDVRGAPSCAPESSQYKDTLDVFYKVTRQMLPDRRCFPSCYCSVLGEPSCAPESSQYKDTLDVFYKVTRQFGLGRLWRGTSASLALTVPTRKPMVSTTAGLTVLNVIRREKLQENAHIFGTYLQERLISLKDKHESLYNKGEFFKGILSQLFDMQVCVTKRFELCISIICKDGEIPQRTDMMTK